MRQLLNPFIIYFSTGTTFFFEDYEESVSDQFGERVQSQRVPCGRRMLKIKGDVATPFYGGKTLQKLQNGSAVTPTFFDALDFPQVQN